jgi:hypothetical protein
MLRNILMMLGFLIALLPYLGFPYDVDKWIWTLSGLLIVFLVFFSERGRLPSSASVERRDTDLQKMPPQRLEVDHRDVASSPEVSIEQVSVSESAPRTSSAERTVVRENLAQQSVPQRAKRKKRIMESSELHHEEKILPRVQQSADNERS